MIGSHSAIRHEDLSRLCKRYVGGGARPIVVVIADTPRFILCRNPLGHRLTIARLLFALVPLEALVVGEYLLALVALLGLGWLGLSPFLRPLALSSLSSCRHPQRNFANEQY